jgi:putative transposase
MQVTVTAKLKIIPSEEQKTLLIETVRAIKKGLNYVSKIAYTKNQLSQRKLHELTYRNLRGEYALRSQMAQSVVKTVIAKYKSMKSNGVKNTLAVFKKPEYDLVYNRDYSLKNGIFSLNTLEGRIKVPFHSEAMERYFDGTWKFGTAKLVIKKGKFYLHIPMTKEIQEQDLGSIRNVVGVDFGLNFLATTYDSKGVTTFYKGRYIKNKRGHYANVRKSLQQKQTPSARRRLKAIGNRENRWMTDVNHCVSKALVSQAGKNALIVIEDLTNVRQATEKVRKQDRYYSVSWAYAQLRQMVEYKALLGGSKVMAVDPAYTSQSCPKCGHTEKANRNKKLHKFQCKTCGYTTNDDRIGAMNLQLKGIQYLVEVTTQA